MTQFGVQLLSYQILFIPIDLDTIGYLGLVFVKTMIDPMIYSLCYHLATKPGSIGFSIQDVVIFDLCLRLRGFQVKFRHCRKPRQEIQLQTKYLSFNTVRLILSSCLQYYKFSHLTLNCLFIGYPFQISILGLSSVFRLSDCICFPLYMIVI